VVGSWRQLSLALLLLLVISGAAEADASLTFQDLGTVLTGAAVGLPGLANPSAAVLADGRVRLYYSASPAALGIFSAISTDGVHSRRSPAGGGLHSTPTSSASPTAAGAFTTRKPVPGPT
jgi:hypothetical protein